jgi:hypothetical protein
LLYPGTGGSAFNNSYGLYGIAPSIAPGNIVADDGYYYYQADVYQTINGLSPGDSYVLSFYQAGAQQNGAGGSTDEYWRVSLGSQTQLSPDMTAPQGGYTAWTKQTMTFTATGPSEVLNFLSESVYNGDPPIALLQDVSLTPSPEPGYFAVLVAGILSLIAVAKRQRRRRV